MELVAGIDIGGTGTKYGLVDKNGKFIAIENVSTPQFKKPLEFVEKISGKILDMLGSHHLIGIGIGAPNGNFRKGTIEFPPNLPWSGITPLTELFQNKIQVPCVLSNDANAAAIGEMLFGGAKKMNDFIFLTLGTGLGSGIIANRQLVYGHDGFAGELGHLIVVKNGRPCGCGRKGCLETYASATGIKRTVEEWIEQGKKTVLTKRTKTIHSADIAIAAKNGDTLALKAFEFTGEILGEALANSVAYTSPEAIFLSGGLAIARDLLFEPTIHHFEKNLLNIYKNKIKIVPSKLKKNQVGILGAASLIWNQKYFDSSSY